MTNRIPQGQELAKASLSSPRKPKVWVWRLKGNERGTVVLYSETFWGYTVHYDARAKRSSPHWSDKSVCQGCQEELPTKEVFYLHGYHVEKARQVFLEMPRGAADKLQAMLAHGETFRGLCLHVSRTPADNGRLQFRFVTCEHGDKKLPRDLDPRDTLFAMWGIKLHDPRGGLECPTGDEPFFARNGMK